GTLQVREQTDGPHKEKEQDQAVPDKQEHGRRHFVEKKGDADPDAKKNDGGKDELDGKDGEDDLVGDAAARELVDAQPPVQPEERAQVLPVHGVASFGAASASS